MRKFKIDVGGVPFTVQTKSFKGKDHDGVCIRSTRQIFIDRSLQGEEFAEILIHEILHAARWSASEKWVTSTAVTIADALVKSGVISKD